MSKLNFSKWDLNKSFKLNEQSDMSFGKSLYGRDSISDKQASDIEDAYFDDTVSEEEGVLLSDYYSNQDLEDANDASTFLYQRNIEDVAFSEQPDVIIVDDPFDAGMFEINNLNLENDDRFFESEDNENAKSDQSLYGLEGPFSFKGRQLYYDPKEGKYYDRTTDMYLDDEEAKIWTLNENDDNLIDVSSLSIFEQGLVNRLFASDTRELPKAAGKKTELPSNFAAWVDSYKRNTAPQTKTMLAKKVLDSIGIENEDAALRNLSHWIDYEPKAMKGIYSRLKSDAESKVSEDNGDVLPEPFLTHGFPKVKMRDSK